MQVQVSADNHIQGSTELTYQAEIVVINKLRHFGDRITCVDVHLSDENGRQEHGATTSVA